MKVTEPININGIGSSSGEGVKGGTALGGFLLFILMGAFGTLFFLSAVATNYPSDRAGSVLALFALCGILGLIIMFYGLFAQAAPVKIHHSYDQPYGGPSMSVSYDQRDRHGASKVEGIPDRPSMFEFVKGRGPLKDDQTICTSCGSVVETEWDHCPYCGSDFYKECPGCDRKIPFNWVMCAHCGHDFRGEKESLSSRIKKTFDKSSDTPDDEKVAPLRMAPIGRCPECNSPIYSVWDECHLCGWKVERSKLKEL